MGYDGYEVGDDEYYLDDLEDEALDNWRYRINETDDEESEEEESKEDESDEDMDSDSMGFDVNQATISTAVF